MVNCESCRREVVDPDASFCPRCGALLPGRVASKEPSSVAVGPVPDPAADQDRSEILSMPAPPRLTGTGTGPGTATGPVPVPIDPRTGAPRWSTFAGAAAALARPTADNRLAAVNALVASALAVFAVFQTWFRVAIDGFVAPGSGETGWVNSGGKAVFVAGLVSGLVGVALLLRRADVWLRVALFVTGGASVTIALANLADAQSKGDAIQSEFGIPAADIRTQVGLGLFLAALSGCAMLGAGLVARNPPQ